MPSLPVAPCGWSWHVDRGSHGLHIALPTGSSGAVVLDRLRAAATAESSLAEVWLWVDRLDLTSDDSRAEHRRERELSRALHADGPWVRAVVLDYADGVAELVLTARRDCMGRSGMARLAAVLAGTFAGPAEVPADHAPRWGVAARVLPPAPAWGLGEPAHISEYGAVAFDLPAPASAVSAAAVLALLLRRYGTDPVRFAVVADADGPGPDGVALYEGDITGQTPVMELPGVVTPVTRPGVDVLAEPPAIGLVMTSAPGEHRPGTAPPFPITIVWQRKPDGTVSGYCWYERSALSPVIAHQFVRHLGRAASAVAGSTPSDTVAGVVLMTPEETAATLAAGRTPAPTAATAATIHAAVAASARQTPYAVAYCDDNGSLTYHELDTAASAMAGALRHAGVDISGRVGVCMHRGADLIVAMLAILRAGAAYVPMDVRHPAERLRYTTRDSGVDLVVTDFAEFPEIDGVRTFHPTQLRGTSAMLLLDDGEAGETAYVIYTSGSTGRPKGVMVPHRNVMALLAATTGDMGLRPDDVWTWFHSGAFDFAVWEIWGCLITGGRLVGVSHETSRSPEAFYELLRRERVTVLNQTPSAFALVQTADRDGRSELALRLVIFGGEPLDVATLRDWFNEHPHTRCRMVNMFGITETTVHVTARTVTPLDVAQRSRSVGTALPGWSVSVRDAQQRPLPFGVAGEIYVGGAGVADGYLGKPDLTAERFIEDPYGADRIYRSGDYGRLHPDGTLDHLGRVDSQVQLRGHRIELDEIRAIILEDPTVRAAVVVVGYASPDDAASARLDAYVVADAPVTSADVRRRVAGFLPEYMVPSTVTTLDSFPLTVNGKVDTTRLPAPVTGHATVALPPPEPRDRLSLSPLRATLRRLWGEIFDAEIGDYDDFFELGGNSLLALRMFAGLRAAGLGPIALRDLYLNPRIADLVPVMETGGVR